MQRPWNLFLFLTSNSRLPDIGWRPFETKIHYRDQLEEPETDVAYYRELDSQGQGAGPVSPQGSVVNAGDCEAELVSITNFSRDVIGAMTTGFIASSRVLRGTFVCLYTNKMRVPRR